MGNGGDKGYLDAKQVIPYSVFFVTVLFVNQGTAILLSIHTVHIFMKAHYLFLEKRARGERRAR